MQRPVHICKLHIKLESPVTHYVCVEKLGCVKHLGARGIHLPTWHEDSTFNGRSTECSLLNQFHSSGGQVLKISSHWHKSRLGSSIRFDLAKTSIPACQLSCTLPAYMESPNAPFELCVAHTHVNTPNPTLYMSAHPFTCIAVTLW